MGVEYRLRFRNDEGVDVIAALARLRDAKPISPSELEFRSAGAAQGMPDASVKLEPGGLYFCDNGGAGRDFLGRVVAKLVATCREVTVEDYEP
jgi:hypothetical protein